MLTSLSRIRLIILILAIAALAPIRARPEDNYRVTVVAILASDQNANVDPKLREVANEVQKREPGLTSFRIDRVTCKSIKPGERETYNLPEDTNISVALFRDTEDGRTRLIVKPPTVGEITYVCKCGKFFPIVTRHVTREKERLIVAVMTRPCTKK